MSTLKHKLKKILGWGVMIALLTGLILPALVSVKPAKAWDPCDSETMEDWIICDQEEENTSFVDFQGDYSPPEAEGYAEGITQTSSAREFVVNVTNFVLSFLGLAAVVVIIYGGFLYVTAGGESEKADKGKKSVMYAVMGIIVVLISYALVNTIIQGAAGGEGAGSGGGLYSAGGVTSESMSIYQSQDMLDIIIESSQTLVAEYTKLVNVGSILGAVANVGAFNDEGLNEIESSFNLVLDEIDSYSTSYDLTREALELINRYLSLNNENSYLSKVGNWLKVNVLLASAEEEAANAACIESCSTLGFSDLPSCLAGCMEETAITEINDPYQVGAQLISYMQQITNASKTDFQNEMDDITTTLETMQSSFTDLPLINSYFDEILVLLDDYSPGKTWDDTTNDSYDFEYFYVDTTSSINIYTNTPGGSKQISDMLTVLNNIYLSIKDLEFTTAIITANTKGGNAPLTTTFNGLNSYDPTELTIPNENYHWDLEGDGFNDDEADATGASVSYTYDTPGTYRVALRVDSQGDDIASGISYLSIKVNPPSSIINLTAQCQLSSCTEEDLSDSTKTDWTITGEQARSGVVFDASGTTDGEGNSNTITNFDFDYGDGDSDSSASSTVTHYYDSEGEYNFVLEVTDQNGVTDRKRIKLIVASPAADIQADKTSGQIGDEINFDASGSVTDNGSIESYTWKIYQDGTLIDLDTAGNTSKETTVPEFSYTFEEPGEYAVTVSVLDSNNLSNEDSVNVTIESSEPNAAFNYKITDETHPGRVNFDARDSKDPDKTTDSSGDLTYKWTIDAIEGTDYKFIEGTDSTWEAPIIDFYKVADYDVTLTVYNTHTGDLQKSNSYTRKISITSVLSIEAEVASGDASFLDENGTASVTLSLNSNYGVSYEIDWADGGTKETVPVSAVGTAKTATHTYNVAGTYPVSVTVYDSSNKTNKTTRNVYIGNGEAPIPIIKVYIDEVESADANNIYGHSKNSFRFDAGDSLDEYGNDITTSNSFNWDFGDGSQLVSAERITRPYEETGTYEVTLTVISPNDSAKIATLTVTIHIEEAEPIIYSVSVTPDSGTPDNDDNITPVTLKIDVNAKDFDGEIKSYKVWYYDVSNSSQQLDTQISTINPISLTINTNGTSGEEKTYGFVVEVTDDDNNTVSSLDQLPESGQPTFEAENGTNQAPIADFTVNKTNLMMGETIIFTSSSYDEDGQLSELEYNWDLDGDGFSGQWTQEKSIEYTYKYVSRDGISVRLKVRDGGGATGVSDPVKIYVDSLTLDPEADFGWKISSDDPLTVEFTDNSIFYTEPLQNNYDFDKAWIWDFDGDGKTDSTEQNPSYTYETTGNYTVKLTVTDEELNESESTSKTVTIADIGKPIAKFEAIRSDKSENDDVIDWNQVQFKNYSSVGEGAEIVEYAWYFDTDKPTLDNLRNVQVDSTEATPNGDGLYTYDLDNYSDADTTGEISPKVKLIVIDNLGRTSEDGQTITLQKPEETVKDLELRFGANGQDGTESNTYIITGDEGDVTFWFLAKNVTGQATFCLDQDSDWDSTGDGIGDNDCDKVTIEGGTMKDTRYTALDSEIKYATHKFKREYSTQNKIIATLYVTDEEGDLDEYLSNSPGSRGAAATFTVKFAEVAPTTGSTSMLPVTSVEALYILAIAFVFTLIGAKIYIKQGSKESSDN